MDNCSLLITDYTDYSDSTPIYISYRAPRGLSWDYATDVTMDMTSNSGNLQILNSLDPRYCAVQLLVAPGFPLGSLQISCPTCNITQQTSAQLQVNGLLNITGQSLNANFQDLLVGSINYQAYEGYLQLNNIISASANNSITMLKEGDIIIQSTQDFQIDATSDTQAFCFSAPVLNNVSVSNCAISGQSNIFKKPDLLIDYN